MDSCPFFFFFIELNFRDGERIYSSRSTYELLRGYFVLKACTIPAVSQNTERLWRLATNVLSTPVAAKLVEKTFFAHFCGGTDERKLSKAMMRLSELNVKAILDYAAEEDPESAVESRPIAKRGALSRVYDYAGEAACDANMSRFLTAVEAAAKDENGFAVLKLTALCRPQLLIRASESLKAVENLWNALLEQQRGNKNVRPASRPDRLNLEGFVYGMEGLGISGGQDMRRYLEELFHRLEGSADGEIDFLEWSSTFDIESLLSRSSWSQKVGIDVEKIFGGKLKQISADDTLALDNMRARLDMVAGRAANLGVRFMIDAEHTYIQPAIDQVTHNLQFHYNNLKRPYPIVYNTYQCYLKDSYKRIEQDLERCEKRKIWFAAKIVRGAYLVRERERVRELSQSYDPIWPTIEETHRNYDAVVDLILRNHNRAHLMIATHNEDSIKNAARKMQQLGIPNNAMSVTFAQLLGMADHLTLTLGSAGFNAYKYLPYGEVKMVIPYLTRRAQENSDVLRNVGVELKMMKESLKRRGIWVP
eukprot:comp22019_c0_seq2/m.50663 comp22019_c0_seq2/g.50663  ORF comp22019_c0_seq2/g.50663 comp22019_c0_seq2/m.50663 type:complete len:534 (-) comp22019_c0_seq2:39-1640(-)